jgi:hypothetical protein
MAAAAIIEAFFCIPNKGAVAQIPGCVPFTEDLSRRMQHFPRASFLFCPQELRSDAALNGMIAKETQAAAASCERINEDMRGR